MEEENLVPDFRDIEGKMGRKVPDSLIRSIAEGVQRGKSDSKFTPPTTGSNQYTTNNLQRLESKMLFLKQEMAHLRAIDVKLMHQLLSINEGIESIRWVMEERGGVASRESSLNGSLYSLSESQEASDQGSLIGFHDRTDELDGISLGSYLDTLGEDLEDHPSPTDLSGSFKDQSVIKDDAFDPEWTQSPLRPRVDSDEYYCFG